MSQFLIGKGVEIKVDGIDYVGDDEGVVNIPSEFDERLINVHGLSLYVPKDAASDDQDAPKAPKRGRPPKDAASDEAKE